MVTNVINQWCQPNGVHQWVPASPWWSSCWRDVRSRPQGWIVRSATVETCGESPTFRSGGIWWYEKVQRFSKSFQRAIDAQCTFPNLAMLGPSLVFFPGQRSTWKKSWHSGTKIMGFFYGFTMVSLWFLGSSTLASRQAQGIQGLRAKPGVRKRSPKSTVGTSRCGLGRPISMGKSHLKWIITMDNFMDNMTILWIMTRRMVYSEQFQSKMDGLEGTIPV